MPNRYPILFSDPMISAILDGSKTQTRRVVTRLLPPGATRWELFPEWGTVNWYPSSRSGKMFLMDEWNKPLKSPYGHKGDLLWVREAHALVAATAYQASREEDGGQIPHRVSPDSDTWAVYRQGWTRVKPCPWRPSIHMHKWASRITLLVEDMRVEPLQAITDIDIVAEGGPCTGTCAWEWFIPLWDKINARRGYSFDSDPFVWVVTFKVLEPENERRDWESASKDLLEARAGLWEKLAMGSWETDDV